MSKVYIKGWKCPNCGKEVKEESNYTSGYGFTPEKKCEDCGEKMQMQESHTDDSDYP